MGNYLNSTVEENIKRNQEFVNEINTIKIERQLQMRKQMRDREMALSIAKEREKFFWFGAFYLTTITWAIASYKYRGRFVIVSPFVPLSFLMAYQADLAYGNKTHRILVEAEHIMQFEQELLAIPLGVPTAASLDIGRSQNDEQKKLHPILPPI